MSANDLVDRVWDAVPVTQPAFAKLLDLLDVEASDDVATAAVTTGFRSRLLLNPDFVERHCRTRERLAMLVMHELMHVLLGHTRLLPRITPAQNWAFDAVINAHLCRQFPEPHWTALFRGCYRAGRFPEALLRPPVGWSAGRPRWALRGEAGRVHRALYSDVSVTCRQLFELLQALDGDGEGARGAGRGACEEDRSGAGRAAGGDGGSATRRGGGGKRAPGSGGKGTPLGGRKGDADGEPAAGDEHRDTSHHAPLLGSHGPDAGALDPDLLREVRDIVARWPMDEVRSGRDQGGELRRRGVEHADPRREAVAVIRRALWPLLEESAEGGALRPATRRTHTVLPYRSGPDRRAAVREAAGETPLLHAASLEARTLARGGRTRVYLDVSGSMLAALPLIVAALRPLHAWLHPRLHLFSTRVRDAALADLARGGVATTLGTDIACVTGHMLAERVERALVITDGWVGDVGAANARALRRRGARVHGVVTHDGAADFLAALRGRAYRLPWLAH